MVQRAGQRPAEVVRERGCEHVAHAVLHCDERRGGIGHRLVEAVMHGFPILGCRLGFGAQDVREDFAQGLVFVQHFRQRVAREPRALVAVLQRDVGVLGRDFAMGVMRQREGHARDECRQRVDEHGMWLDPRTFQ